MTIEHDMALSIHSYYVGEFGTGLRACERLLRQPLEHNTEQAIRTNRCYYMKTLQDLVPVEYKKIECEPARPGWSLFNPSIYKAVDGRMYLMVRSSNYRYNAGNYIIPPEDNNDIKTSSILCELDDSMNLQKSIRIEDPDYPQTTFPVKGIEDARLFEIDGQLVVSGTVRNAAPFDGNCRIGFARIDRSLSKYVDFEVITPEIVRHEKNWSPVLYQSSPTWLYSCGLDGLTTAIQKHGDKLYQKKTESKNRINEGFRGGSQLVPVSDGYLTLVHEVAAGPQGRVYSHRFVLLNHDLAVSQISMPFYLMKPLTIEFAAGLAVIDDKIHISFGYLDESAWIATIDGKDAIKLLSWYPNA